MFSSEKVDSGPTVAELRRQFYATLADDPAQEIKPAKVLYDKPATARERLILNRRREFADWLARIQR